MELVDGSAVHATLYLGGIFGLKRHGLCAGIVLGDGENSHDFRGSPRAGWEIPKLRRRACKCALKEFLQAPFVYFFLRALDSLHWLKILQKDDPVIKIETPAIAFGVRFHGAEEANVMPASWVARNRVHEAHDSIHFYSIFLYGLGDDQSARTWQAAHLSD